MNEIKYLYDRIEFAGRIVSIILSVLLKTHYKQLKRNIKYSEDKTFVFDKFIFKLNEKDEVTVEYCYEEDIPIFYYNIKTDETTYPLVIEKKKDGREDTYSTYKNHLNDIIDDLETIIQNKYSTISRVQYEIDKLKTNK